MRKRPARNKRNDLKGEPKPAAARQKDAPARREPLSEFFAKAGLDGLDIEIERIKAAVRDQGEF